MLLPSEAWGELLVLLVVSVIASNTVAAFGSYLPAVYALFFPAMLPYAVYSVLSGGLMHGVLTVLNLLFILFVGILARRSNLSFVTALELRFRNLKLADDLRVQKESAEQANVAKSRFLASASHDLRQPVHALGLFLGALRTRAMDDEARRLVDQIDGTVKSLDDLFTALLDISKLDAGVVDVSKRAFPIGPLIERVHGDLAVEASEKGISLGFRPCRAWVYSDPFLLERVLRNLASNGVRYTERGRVLIACRPGRNLRLQVWDTGVGIAPEQQALVFQEFYQVANPERDRSKGLGLGLAIVQRLSQLLGAPVTLRSVAGRGSVFTIELPPAETQAMVPVEPEALLSAQAQGLILFVDDEAQIREATDALLSTWGYRVVTAGSGAEMLSRMAALATRPSLIICDYRLRGSENGIDVINMLLAEFGREIPAMLLTGDTAPDRIARAKASGFLLLHKPVPNVRLRAAIGNLIRGAATGVADSP